LGFCAEETGQGYIKEVARCYAVAFDYDEWQCVINDTEKRELPATVKSITYLYASFLSFTL
jgi:hypothetical protein